MEQSEISGDIEEKCEEHFKLNFDNEKYLNFENTVICRTRLKLYISLGEKNFKNFMKKLLTK